jgi:hypothetical protein
MRRCVAGEESLAASVFAAVVMGVSVRDRHTLCDATRYASVKTRIRQAFDS